LEEAKNKAIEQNILVNWEFRDMRDLPWKEEFDGSFCFWGSIGYFDEDGNKDFLSSVYQSIKLGSRFIIDTHIAETLFPKFEHRSWTKIGDILVLEERTYDHATSRVNTEWLFIKNGQQEIKHSSIRIYTYRELCEMLEVTGFVRFEAYGSLSQESFTFGSKRLYLVATKQ
jgi:hypothetical protein